MGRKKKTVPPAGATLQIVSSSSALDDDEQDEFDEIDRMEDGALSAAMESVAKITGAAVEVVKIEEDKQKWCRNYPVSSFSNEKLAADFGAGTYRIRFKGPNKLYLKGGGTIDIAAPLATAVPAAVPGSGITDVLAILKAEREKEKANWMEWAKLLAPLAIPKLLDVFSANKGPTLTELMSVINGAKEFHKPEPQASMAEQLEQFANIMDIAQKMSGGGNSNGATWVDLIRDGINKVPDVLTAVRGGIPLTGPLLPAPEANHSQVLMPAPSSPVSPVTVSPAAASSPVAPTKADGTMDLRMIPWLKQTLESLLQQAQNDRDPDLYAQVTVDNLPNYVNPADLLRFLHRPDWWQLACTQDPRLAGYPGWFNAYHQQVVLLIRDELPSPTPQAPQPSGSAEEEFH